MIILSGCSQKQNEKLGALLGGVAGGTIVGAIGGVAMSPRQDMSSIFGNSPNAPLSCGVTPNANAQSSTTNPNPVSDLGYAKGGNQACGTDLLAVRMRPTLVMPGDEIHIAVTTYDSDSRAPNEEVQIVRQSDEPTKPLITITQGQTDESGEFTTTWQTPAAFALQSEVLATLHVYAFDMQKKDCSMTLLVIGEVP